MRESLLEALITGKCLLGLFAIILPDPFSRKKHQFYKELYLKLCTTLVMGFICNDLVNVIY